ncbi:hypothetical protein MED121_23014 [Marinomonas sp. MED121]|nr:hypothetical protein MED121_23014 [Marinomonas sp. MED121]
MLNKDEVLKIEAGTFSAFSQLISSRQDSVLIWVRKTAFLAIKKQYNKTLLTRFVSSVLFLSIVSFAP